MKIILQEIAALAAQMFGASTTAIVYRPPGVEAIEIDQGEDPADRAAVAELIATLESSGDRGFVEQVHEPGGAARYRHRAAQALVDADGRAVGALCVFRSTAARATDAERLQIASLARTASRMCERVRQERWLRARDPHLSSVLETMAEGLVIHSSEGRIVHANSAAGRILGLTHDQLLGRTSMDPEWQAVAEDESPLPGEQHPAMISLRTGAPLRGFLIGVGPAAARRWLSVNTQPLYDDAAAAPSGVLATFTDVTELRAGLGRIRELARKLDRAGERERHTIALALNEGIAQDLYGMRLMLQQIADPASDPARLRELCVELRAALEQCMADVRAVANDLRPSELAHLSVGDAIRRHAGRFAGLTGLEIDVHTAGPLPAIDEVRQLFLYRAAQEALINVARHARARRIEVELAGTPAAVELRVRDDGVGIDVADLTKAGTFGLLAIRERCREVGGSLRVATHAAGGTEFALQLAAPASQEPNAPPCVV